MKTPYRGGGKKFGSGFGGGAKPWKREGGSDRGNGHMVMHSAVCVTCGNTCQVPFRPNGSKPIYCSNCFKRDERGPAKRFDRPSFGDRRSTPSRSFDRPSFGDDRRETSSGNGKIEARLSAIEEKLDMLLEMLTEE